MILQTVLNFHVLAKNMMVVRTVMVNSTTKYWTNLAARSLFTNEYLDSVNFQIERRKARGGVDVALKTKHRIIKLYDKKGITGMSTKNLLLLMHCIEPGDVEDMSFLTEILEKDCQTCHSAAGPRLNASYCVLTSSQDKHLLNCRARNHTQLF